MNSFFFFISFSKLEVFLIEKIHEHFIGNISFHVVAFVAFLFFILLFENFINVHRGTFLMA